MLAKKFKAAGDMNNMTIEDGHGNNTDAEAMAVDDNTPDEDNKEVQAPTLADFLPPASDFGW